jgi:hypothetical protein
MVAYDHTSAESPRRHARATRQRVSASVIDVLEERVSAELANPAILTASATTSTNDERLHT